MLPYVLWGRDKIPLTSVARHHLEALRNSMIGILRFFGARIKSWFCIPFFQRHNAQSMISSMVHLIDPMRGGLIPYVHPCRLTGNYVVIPWFGSLIQIGRCKTVFYQVCISALSFYCLPGADSLCKLVAGFVRPLKSSYNLGH